MCGYRRSYSLFNWKGPHSYTENCRQADSKKGEEGLGGQLKDLGGMQGMDSKKMEKLKKKYGGMMK